jgi:hypothetical protein
MGFMKAAVVSMAGTNRIGSEPSRRSALNSVRKRYTATMAAEAREGFMNCLECAALDRDLNAALARYMAARSAVFYRVSTELAAMNQVDMERARANVQEHKLVCHFGAEAGPTTDIEVENPGAVRRLGK